MEVRHAPCGSRSGVVGINSLLDQSPTVAAVIGEISRSLWEILETPSSEWQSQVVPRAPRPDTGVGAFLFYPIVFYYFYF